MTEARSIVKGHAADYRLPTTHVLRSLLSRSIKSFAYPVSAGRRPKRQKV